MQPEQAASDNDMLAVLAERIADNRVCLLSIEAELIEAMLQMALETRGTPPALSPPA